MAPSKGQGHAAFMAGLSVVAVVVFANSLKAGFVFDDVTAIVENKDLRPHTPLTSVFTHDFWGTPMSREHSHKSYRPLCVLTFRLNYLLHGLQPLGYHLINIVLHGLVCVLYYKTCLVFVRPKVAKICAALFAVHPIHTEAVTGVVGRAELLSSIFFLLTLLTYRRACIKESKKQPGWILYLTLSMVFTAFAMLSKEQGITVLGAVVVYEVFVIQKLDVLAIIFQPRSLSVNNNQAKHKYWPCAARLTSVILTGILLMVFRFLIMGHTLPVFTNFDNPSSYEEAPVKQMTYAYLIALNIWLLLSPAQLLCDWTMGTVALIKSVGDVRNLATVFTFITLVHLGFTALFSKNDSGSSKKFKNALVMALALMVLPFLPASNLFFPVGFVIAERVLYIPSMGFCLLVGIGFHRLVKITSRVRLLYSLLATILVMDSLKCVLRNEDWMTEESVFMSGLKVSKTNAKLWNNVGHALESSKNYARALKFFQQATIVQPDDVGAHINVGRTLNHLERFQDAELAYLKAKSLLPQPKPGQKYVTRIAPQHLSVFLNLGNLMAKDSKRLEEADGLYKQAISMRTDYVQAYINRGDVLIKMGKPDEALEVYETALTFEPENADLYYNLGVVLIELGQPDRALERFAKALEADPEHVQSLMNSAILMQESGKKEWRPEAYSKLFRVMERQPDNDRVYFNLGMLAMDDGETAKAEIWFGKAIELRPDFRSALFNLALLLNEEKRPREALPILESLLFYYPGHVKGLILLGDIYTNHVKDLDKAEETYSKILAVDPNHVQGRHNLCVVMVEKGELVKARECLLTVHKMAPDEAYIKRHLQIVESRLAKQNQNP